VDYTDVIYLTGNITTPAKYVLVFVLSVMISVTPEKHASPIKLLPVKHALVVSLTLERHVSSVSLIMVENSL
jgi:hypothetical protein